MSRTRKVLQGLRHPFNRASSPCSPIVLDREDSPIYRSFRQPLFFVDGSLAVGGREPQLVCDDYRLKVRQSNGRVCWIRVSRDAYQHAAIGQPLPV